jgi:hypothetical protein
MYRNAHVLCFLVLTVAGLSGCSSGPSIKESKKVETPPDKIQGKAQENPSESTAADAAFNAGGHSVYLVDGLHRYRLFFKTAFQVDPGKEYIAEGVYAQKAIDEIGDPDQGKNGYPLQSSCERVVKTAWPGLAFDVADLHTAALCARVKRYPARPIFLVTRLLPVASKESGTAEPKKDAEAENVPKVPVAADKQRALLIEGPTVQTAPLWAPAGGTVRCKLVIDKEGRILELETGAQLCESVPWSQFRYKPTLQGGHLVKVETEVEVRFDPRT